MEGSRSATTAEDSSSQQVNPFATPGAESTENPFATPVAATPIAESVASRRLTQRNASSYDSEFIRQLLNVLLLTVFSHWTASALQEQSSSGRV